VKSFPGFCGCETCRDDVIVFALNRIPPHYVTHRRGAVLQHIKMQRDQEVADISVALLEGFRRVQKAPRPDHLGPAERPAR
jgi:competence protein ComFB